jgi:peptide methionine sulfoxide reductase MsrA
LFNSLNLYYLNTTHLKSLIAFPSLVNELFTCLDPLSVHRQANDQCKYLPRLVMDNR